MDFGLSLLQRCVLATAFGGGTGGEAHQYGTLHHGAFVFSNRPHTAVKVAYITIDHEAEALGVGVFLFVFLNSFSIEPRVAWAEGIVITREVFEPAV